MPCLGAMLAFHAAALMTPGINRVRFDGNDEIIEAMISVEGEVVELVNKARLVNVNEGDKKGNVERWLLEVQDSMIKTLTKVDNIYWTQEVAEAIEKGNMAQYYEAHWLVGENM
eukprot:Skav220031  [mRNA]  locus=scaffold2981:152294:153564:+ [translate_table: standard]